MIIRYHGRMQRFSGGGGAQFFGFWVYMPRSSMSRAVARGVWEHAPPRKFKKMVQFRAFRGLFSTTFMIENPLKKLKINRIFFTDPFIMLLPHQFT